jgi:thiol-disulfide isomerase/thioredoxin
MKCFKPWIFSLLLFSCNNAKKLETKAVEKTAHENHKSEVVDTLELEVFDFNGLEKLLNKKDGKIYVINFWATWCAPCVKELPHFEKINSKYLNSNVEVVLVSLDFPHMYESKLKPFVKEKNLKSKVVVLDDADMDTWIPKVDKTWSGSIPATIIYENNKRKFFEKSFTFEELETEIKQFLK